MIQMPLEARLDHVQRHCPSNIDHYGDDEFTVTNPDTEIALAQLLDRIKRLLQQRPVHTHQVDLLHLLAMMIHPRTPQPSTSTVIPKFLSTNYSSSSTTLERSPAWQRAVRLMERQPQQHSTIGTTQLQIHDGHRRQIVQMIDSVILLPEARVYDHVPLLAGAVPHLLTCLHEWWLYCCSHQNDMDAAPQLAIRAMVALVVQCQNVGHSSSDDDDEPENDDNNAFIPSAMYDWLIDSMMEERENCHCNGHDDHSKCASANGNNNNDDDMVRSFCWYRSRGAVISDLILGTCRNQPPPNVPATFLAHVAHSLAELIEWQVDYWNMKLDDGMDVETTTETTTTVSSNDDKKTYSPCLLASLLLAAGQLFYFLDNDNNDGNDKDGNDDNPYDLMIRCSISMLRHSEPCIVSAAEGLLQQSFKMIHGKQAKRLALLLSQSIIATYTLKRNHSEGSLIKPLVAVASGKSHSAAESLFNFVVPHLKSYLTEGSGDTEPQSVNVLSFEEASAWLEMIIMNCPSILIKNSDLLVSAVAKDTVSTECRHVIAKSLLYGRLTHYFINEKDNNVQSIVETFLSSSTSHDHWAKYNMGRHALVSGHFGVAQTIFQSILDNCESMDTAHYLWISALERVSGAEAIFSAVTDLKTCKGSSIGIPDASTKLYSAVSYIEMLHKTCTSWANSGLFQLRFLLLRLDFIDLVTVLRHLTCERRLTGKSPSKQTRSYWHLLNVVKSFDVLARRYHELYQQFGMCFVHHQSTISLALLQSLSSFMAVVARVCFSEVFTTGKSSAMKTSFIKVGDNINHPMASLMRRLYDLVIKPMIGSKTIDNRMRASATVDLIDGIFLVPFPIPRDFFVPIPSGRPILSISADPNPIFDDPDETLSMIESAPTIGFSFNVSGSINVDYLKVSRVPVWSIVLWFHIKYVGPLISDDEDHNDITGVDLTMTDDASPFVDSQIEEVPIPDLSVVSPAVSRISTNGQFFFSVECPPLIVEGNYLLCSKLGCRDATGNDWEIPACHHTAPIQISRARSIAKSSVPTTKPQ